MKKQLNMTLILFVLIIISLFFLSGCPRIDILNFFLLDEEEGTSLESSDRYQNGKPGVCVSVFHEIKAGTSIDYRI